MGLPPTQQDNDPRRMDALSAAKAPWKKHPVDIRISVPFFGERYYMTIVGGREKRGRERVKSEGTEHALMTASNLVFIIMMVLWSGVVVFIAAQPVMMLLDRFFE